ncbi:MAG TPA: AAA family ATPase [Planctomycetota bacterium]|jgi:predicted ATPase|nr:AAA family ATPase [Planctomycetota bacterium]
MPVFVREVALRHYRSISRCRVPLSSLTVLVGPNGSGKSSFLDALHFVTDALNTTLENALRDRGGIDSVRGRSGGRPTDFGIQLSLNLREGGSATYGFLVRAEKNRAFSVKHEECRVEGAPLRGPEPAHFVVERGRVLSIRPAVRTAVEPDRLFLTAVSASPEFRPVYDGLSRMGFYNLNPDRIRDLQNPDPGKRLARDGHNIASVLRELKRTTPAAKDTVSEYLRKIVPGVESVEPKTLGPKETLEFRQSHGDSRPWKFLAGEMSDGTLRALGVLVAVFHAEADAAQSVPLVGIEEPEVAIHPGAAEVLAEALLGASETVQILLTTHSPDFLDHKAFGPEHLRSVDLLEGSTIITSIDEAARSALRDRLYSAGELLRMGQIETNPEAFRTVARERDLFEAGPDG